MYESREVREMQVDALKRVVAELIALERSDGADIIAQGLEDEFTEKAWQFALIPPQERPGFNSWFKYKNLPEEVASSIFDVYFTFGCNNATELMELQDKLAIIKDVVK